MHQLVKIDEMKYNGKCITQYVYNAMGVTSSGMQVPVQVLVSTSEEISEILLQNKRAASPKDQQIIDLFNNWFWKQWLYKKDKADARKVFVGLFRDKSQAVKAIIFENLTKHLQQHLENLSDPKYCGKAGKWLRAQDFTIAPERDDDDGAVGYLDDDGNFIEVEWGDE